MHYTTLHPAVVVRWPLQPLQPLQKTQLQPPFGPSVDSLCHPWFTTTNLSYRFHFFETSATALCGTTGISSFTRNNFMVQLRTIKILTETNRKTNRNWLKTLHHLKGPSNSMSPSSNRRSWSSKLKGQILRGHWPGDYLPEFIKQMMNKNWVKRWNSLSDMKKNKSMAGSGLACSSGPRNSGLQTADGWKITSEIAF